MASSKALILAVDDEPFFLNDLKYEFMGKNVELKTYLGHNEFEEQVSNNDIERASVILIDYDLRSCTSVDRDFPRYIRKHPNFKGKLALVSLHEDFGDHSKVIRDSYDAVFKKEDFGWEDVSTLLGIESCPVES